MAQAEATPPTAAPAPQPVVRREVFGVRTPVPEAWRLPISVVPLLLLAFTFDRPWALAAAEGATIRMETTLRRGSRFRLEFPCAEAG